MSGIAGLRRMARPAAAPAAEGCDLCRTSLPDGHRHLLQLAERRILCVCEACWAMRSGDAELRPVGRRTLWLEDLRLPDALWAELRIPIGLAFFLHSSVTDDVVAMYPSPVGATESALPPGAWAKLTALNPPLATLEPDVEGLIVNRLGGPQVAAIAPIDRCYGLVGLIKSRWEGISGGDGVERAIAEFFVALRVRP